MSTTSTASEPLTAANGVQLHVEDTGGDDRPVVLVHGWPLSGAAFQPQVQPLVEAGNRVVTYDRRGFGRSDKPDTGYDYDTMAADLDLLLNHLELRGAVLVGFSMGGGEVARHLATFGDDRVAGAVFASAVTPFLQRTTDNVDGALDDDAIEAMKHQLAGDRDGFFDDFTTTFFTADDELRVDESQRADALALCHQSDEQAAYDCIDAFARTDFRDDLGLVRVPALVVHGDDDAIVAFEASAPRTHDALLDSTLHVVAGGPHGLNVSHADEFNRALVDFVERF